jgi:hypothetical protein
MMIIFNKIYKRVEVKPKHAALLILLVRDNPQNPQRQIFQPTVDDAGCHAKNDLQSCVLQTPPWRSVLLQQLQLVPAYGA